LPLILAATAGFLLVGIFLRRPGQIAMASAFLSFVLAALIWLNEL
jgi:hypothetical protein